MASSEVSLDASAPADLAKNAALLDAAEVTLANVLLRSGQAHLFEDWADPGTDDAQKHAFFDQESIRHTVING